MDMDQASVFLAGSILTCLGFVVIAIAILVINNLCAKYWRPVTWIRFDDVPTRFASQEEAEKSQEHQIK
jgi:hypothetical protein